MQKEKKKQYIIQLFFLFFFLGCFSWACGRYQIQTVSMWAITKDAIKNKEAIKGDKKVKVKEALIPGEEYEIIVEFDIVKRKGIGLFTSRKADADNRAVFGCDTLKTKQMIFAAKKRLQIDLMLGITEDEITDQDGNSFDKKTQMLHPVVTVKRMTHNNKHE